MKNDDIYSFIENSYFRLMDYEKKGRYFHALTLSDNSPTVVHKKTNQFTYVIFGEGSVWLNGKQRKIQARDYMFIEAGTTHRFVAESVELILFQIHIPDEGRDTDRYIIEGEDYDRFKI